MAKLISLNPVSLNESSLRINLLHKVLKAFGFPVSKAEEKSYKAGNSTENKMRALQKKLKIKYDENYIMDQNTIDSLNEEMIKAGFTDKCNTFLVRGSVFNRKGEVVKNQKLLALDVDLRGAAIYRSVKSIRAIKEYGGFEYLNERNSDNKGNFYIKFFDFQYTKAERKKADVVVYAISGEGEILGRSRLVNSEEYSDTAEVSNLNVLISEEETGTEYEILMGKLIPFLKESRVILFELSDSEEQVHFASDELDEKELNIRIAVEAESLRMKKKDYKNNEKIGSGKIKGQKNPNEMCNCQNLSHELVYGLGRQNITLNWQVLYKRTKGELVKAIEKSVNEKIIKEYDKKDIDTFLKIIHNCAGEYILLYKGENQPYSLAKILSSALHKKEQQTAFINAYRNFKNQVPENETITFNKFWSEYLPKIKEFKENPELIDGLLLTQQLTIISAGHQPLMQELQVNRKISSVTELVSIEETTWKEIISKSGVPEFIKGKDQDERI